MAYHAYSTPQNSEETRGNAITQPWSHPIKEIQNLGFVVQPQLCLLLKMASFYNFMEPKPPLLPVCRQTG